jgi:hypothetical protein
VRVGVGDNQEIGVEADYYRAHAQSVHCVVDCEGDANPSNELGVSGAALSWKLGLTPQLALLATVGGERHVDLGGDPTPQGDFAGTSLNGSFGFIASSPIGVHGADLYVGGRLSAATPVGTPVANADAHSIGALFAALGSRFPMGDNAHLYAEIGALLTTQITLGLTAVGGIGFRL